MKEAHPAALRIRLSHMGSIPDALFDFFENSQQESHQALIPEPGRRMDLLQLRSDFNIDGSGFLKRQNLRRENASVPRHEKTDNAGNGRVRGDCAPEKFHSQDA